MLGAIFIRRSARHAEPVLDLSLFGARSFSAANAATLLYAMGFFAMLLGNILFLTSVWHYTILRAGLAVTPGPLVVAVVSGPAGKMAGRFGFRKVLLVGFAVFAAGLVWYATKVGLHPDYLERLASRNSRGRTRDRPHVPGAQCRGGVEPPPRAIRRRQRREPDRPPGGRGTRSRSSRRDSRHPDQCSCGAFEFSPPLVVRSSDGGTVRTDEHPVTAGSRSDRF